MRTLPLALLAPAFALAWALPARLAAQAVNPLQVALLKWAPASGNAFPVGNGLDGLAFDGAAMWLANFTSFSVTKLRASDAAVPGTFGVPNPPNGVAYDGANLWVTTAGDVVTKLRDSDGAALGTFALGANPGNKIG